MTPQAANAFIESQISVTRQMVTMAKSMILSSLTRDTATLVRLVPEVAKAPLPEEVLIHDSVNPEIELARVAQSLSWRYAAIEALWGLIASSALIPCGSFQPCGIGVRWSTIVQGGGERGGWTFDAGYVVPQHVSLAPSRRVPQPDQPLTDPDLFLLEVGIPGLHPEIQQALREAVKCFRDELFLAALVMLGAASEAAWNRVAEAIVTRLEEIDPAAATKQRENLTGPLISAAKTITGVLRVLERPDLKPVLDSIRIRRADLAALAVWADAVRDARNAIHLGVEPAMSNSYEKVTALMIGAAPHLRWLYKLYEAARS